MKIINQTRSIVVADDAIVANTLLSRVRGLLGKKGLNKGQALILKPSNSIHTCIMRFPIDVLFVDKDNQVIGTVHSLAPFRLTRVYLKAKFTVELSAGAIGKTATHIGDKLILQ